MKPLIILGAGDFAEVASVYMREAGWKVEIHLIDDARFKKVEKLNGVNVLVASTAECTRQFPPRYFDAFVAIGYSRLNAHRVKKSEELRALGYDMPSFVHPEVKPHGKIGAGCFVFERNTIQPFSEIGDYSVLWSGNHVGHHTVIERGVFVTSHVCISSRCRVGERSFLGVNSSLDDGISVGACSIVQSGSLVNQNLPADSVFTREGLSKVPSSRVKL